MTNNNVSGGGVPHHLLYILRLHNISFSSLKDCHVHCQDYNISQITYTKCWIVLAYGTNFLAPPSSFGFKKVPWWHIWYISSSSLLRVNKSFQEVMSRNTLSLMGLSSDFYSLEVFHYDISLTWSNYSLCLTGFYKYLFLLKLGLSSSNSWTVGQTEQVLWICFICCGDNLISS